MFGDSLFSVNNCNNYTFLKISNGTSGRIPLVFLHGMFGGLSNFDPLIREIKEYTVYVPKIPLYQLKRSRLTIPGLADWLKGFMEACSIERPLLLGNSLGGHIALEYARAFPDNLAGLVLTGSSGLFENDFGSTCPKRRDREYIKKRAALTFYDDIVDDTIIDEILAVTQSPDKLPKLLAIARSTHSYNMEDELQHILAPVLLIWGKNDIITPPEVALLFKKKLPNASLKWIDRCGHAPMLERPYEFSQYLKEFVIELENRIANKTGTTA